MKTAILLIKYHEDAGESDIQNIVSDFYASNDKIIKGMSYLEFDGEEPLKKVYRFIEEL